MVGCNEPKRAFGEANNDFNVQMVDQLMATRLGEYPDMIYQKLYPHV